MWRKLLIYTSTTKQLFKAMARFSYMEAMQWTRDHIKMSPHDSDPFAASALERCGWSAPGSGSFIPGKTGVQRIGGWVGPSAGMHSTQNPAPSGIRSPDRPARSGSLYRLSCSQWYTMQTPIFFLKYATNFDCQSGRYRSGKLHNDKRSCSSQVFLRKFRMEFLSSGLTWALG